MFHLPFYTSENEDLKVKHKVVWNGKGDTAPICGKSHSSDTNVYARHYDILLEITQRDGANQWKLEFGTGLRHMEEYIKKTGKLREDIYLFLVAPKIHVDTYTSVRQKVIEGENIILFTFKDVGNIIEVCNLTIGLRHIDLENLMNRLLRCMIDNMDLSHYEKKYEDILVEWRKTFLKNDRLVFLGIKGYKVFREKKQSIMTASDILTEIQAQEDVKKYFDIIGELPKREEVCNGMLTFGFAYESGLPQRDPLLSIASELDINQRMNEILDGIKRP
jgi:hypothetical protein